MIIMMRRKGKQTANRAHFSIIKGFVGSKPIRKQKRENRTDKLSLLMKEYFGK